MKNVALADALELVLRIAKAIGLRAVVYAIKTIQYASPCLSDYRGSVGTQVGKAFAFRTAVSQRE